MLTLVVAVFATTCSSGGDTTKNSNATPTTAGNGDGTDGGEGSGTGGTTPASLAPGGAPQPPSGDLSKPARREDIPRAGRYRYDTTVDGKEGEEVLDVVDSGDGDGYIRQLHIRGQGTTATSQAVVWLADLFYAEAEQRTREGSLGLLCVWNPGFVLLPLPVSLGASFSADSTCVQDNEAEPQRRRTLEARVTGTDRVDVGGRKVDVFVVEQTMTTSTLDDSPPLDLVENQTLTDMVSTDRHLLVRSEGTITSTLNALPQGTPTRFEKELSSLAPE